MGKYDDLKRYTAELIGEVRQVNDIIKIGHPAIAAIVQSKLIAAMSNHINFRHEFSEFDNLTLGVKSVDIVIIIGNLVDNAFDEVMNLPPEQRWVELKGWRSDRNLYISVLNKGSVIREEDVEKIFESGYSTKQNHSGIGLAIVKERVNHYKGTIVVKSDPDHGTEFIVSIPLE
jgi:sensor histidine kinase regulating citrate/malate metabolism